MKKRARQKKNKRPSEQHQPLALHPTIIYCQESDKRYLQSRYKNPSAILDRLCELFPAIATYEVVGEIFFEFVLYEMEQGSPDRERIQLIKNTRYEIVELYELTRAARMLREK
jgi:hypothetical protein